MARIDSWENLLTEKFVCFWVFCYSQYKSQGSDLRILQKCCGRGIPIWILLWRSGGNHGTQPVVIKARYCHRVLTYRWISRRKKSIRCLVWPPYCQPVPPHAQFTTKTYLPKLCMCIYLLTKWRPAYGFLPAFFANRFLCMLTLCVITTLPSALLGWKMKET